MFSDTDTDDTETGRSAASCLIVCDEEELARKESLKLEILTAVKPYTSMTYRPPFTASELICMAACSSKKPTRCILKAEILEWICETFNYYAKCAISLAIRARAPKEHLNSHAGLFDIVAGFSEALESFDLPVQRDSCSQKWPTGSGPIFVCATAGRLYLRKWLEPEREGVFRFLHLPAELRNVVYEKLFSFGQSGIQVSCKDNSWADWKNIRVSYDAYGPYDTSRQLSPPKELFALLSVNRQIYGEAMPYFYSLNHQKFRNMEELAIIGRLMPSCRLRYVKELSFEIFPSRNSTYAYRHKLRDFKSGLQRLADLCQPRKLTIYFMPDDYILSTSRRLLGGLVSERQLRQVSRLPGMRTVTELATRADELMLEPCMGRESTNNQAPSQLEAFILTEAAMYKGRREKKEAAKAAIQKPRRRPRPYKKGK